MLSLMKARNVTVVIWKNAKKWVIVNVVILAMTRKEVVPSKTISNAGRRDCLFVKKLWFLSSHSNFH